jgi:trk system potassium uptake protein TrkA
MYFNVDYFVMSYTLCALEIAKQIRTSHRVETEHFARGQVKMQTYLLNRNSKWAGKSLSGITMPPNIRLGYIQRGDQFIVPTRDTVLEGDDLLTLVSELNAVAGVKNEICTTVVENIRVVIFSGSDITFSLVDMLNHIHFKIKVIEPDRSVCEELAERYEYISVIQGNATSFSLLAEEDVEGCDHFVACGVNDEQNIMACLRARRVGAKTVHMVLNNPDYEPMMDQIGKAFAIDDLISPKLRIYEDTMRFLFPEDVSILGQLGGVAEVLELYIHPGSPCEGKLLRDISFPPKTVILVLNHRFRSKVPSAEDILLGGDSMVVVVQTENKGALLKLFSFS